MKLRGPSAVTGPVGRTTRAHAPRYEVVVLDVDGALHALNNLGAAVGHALDAGGAMRAVAVTPAGTIELGTLGGSASAARGINDAGAIVGGSLTPGDVAHHAFIFENGEMHDLNSLILPEPECELVYALGINNHGDILAIGDYEGADRVLLLKRVLLPAVGST